MSSLTNKKEKLIAKFSNISFLPDTFSSFSWADSQKRLFMAKVKTNINDDGVTDSSNFFFFNKILFYLKN